MKCIARALCIIIVLVVVVFVISAISHIQNVVDEANFPINGKLTFIIAKDVVSYGVAGKPPCLEISDYDCITSYEYAIIATNGNIYRLDREQFPVKFENNTDPRFNELHGRGIVSISCDRLSSNSKDYPGKDAPNWCCTRSDRNYFFGCKISPAPFWRWE